MFASIFAYSEGYLFILLVTSFVMQKVFSLVSSHHSFWLLSCALGSYPFGCRWWACTPHRILPGCYLTWFPFLWAWRQLSLSRWTFCSATHWANHVGHDKHSPLKMPSSMFILQVHTLKFLLAHLPRPSCPGIVQEVVLPHMIAVGMMILFFPPHLSGPS